MEPPKDRSGFLPWFQKTIPAYVLKEGAFADQLTRTLLTADGGAAPSAHTLDTLDWACKEGPSSQGPCLSGMYRFFMSTSELCVCVFFLFCVVFISVCRA